MRGLFAVVVAGPLAVAATGAEPDCDCGARRPAVQEGYVEVDGGRVWYRSLGRSDGATPLLIVHGGPGATSYYVEPLAEALADERRVVIYDQLGCGRSERPRESSLWTVARFERELMRVREVLGLERVVLLGHSWGGQLVVEHVLAGREGVGGLILASPSLSIPRTIADLSRLRSQLPAALQETLRKHEQAGSTDAPAYQAAIDVLYARHLSLAKPRPDELANAFANLGTEVYEHMWGPNEFHAVGTLRSYDVTPRLAELKAPVLFTVGREDEITPEAVAHYASLVGGASVEVIEGSAHMTMNDQPERYERVVRAFLRELDARARE
jgi:proline iminopeptidase